ncbi:tRNA (cytosine(34)-C(5))-methyltransferase, mitochondrial-like [Entelurus aequoreus]|uniref:tRNA (cytosine(34)-C(5))-methyltransferase, mitochondrial-like n=1 Tax=Entelurus aequoreus TaxID=161455 RepID=UPI002B1E4E95|nr:tRNA (cytosine(34)-C(5))-methyltransferase, mitochondrial-like [Entelurus aequoreus]
MFHFLVCSQRTLGVRLGIRRPCSSYGEEGHVAAVKTHEDSITQLKMEGATAKNIGFGRLHRIGKKRHSGGEKVTRGSKRAVCQLVLERFDQQYGEELGDSWASVRSVLLDPASWQHGVLLNRFAAATDAERALLSQGFSTLLPRREGPEGDSRPLPSEADLAPPPPPLQCYIHPRPTRFPSPAHRAGQLKPYYLLNAASLLPVLALQVGDGEKVLDLCAAPGGKALAVMQCATPAFLCCNEPDSHRRERLAKTLESFLPRWMSSRVLVSAQDGRSFGQSEVGKYDKVLVDAPCSNDRSWLFSSADQQMEQRFKERSRLPRLQVQLLRSALSAVRPGGAVVYSTCTMSSTENFAVVEAVLRDCPEAEPEDLQEEIALPLSTHFSFRVGGQVTHPQPLQPQSVRASSRDHKLGILVLPQPRKTWGPMFVSRLRKRKNK